MKVRNWFAKFTKANWEEHLIPLAPFKRYLEIGVYAGDSLCWAAENLVSVDGIAIGVDPYDPSLLRRTLEDAAGTRRAAQTRIKKFVRPQVMLFTEYSDRFLLDEIQNNPPHKYDLILIDGNHAAPAALTDIVLEWRLLADGGIMVIDDIHIRNGRKNRVLPETREAWRAFYNCYNGRYEKVYATKRQAAVRKLS